MKEPEIMHFIYEGMSSSLLQQLLILNPTSVKEPTEKADLVEQSIKRYQGIQSSIVNSINIPTENDKMNQVEKEMGELKETINKFMSKDSFSVNNIQPRNYSRNIHGNPRCVYCKKIGHTKYNCFLLQAKYRNNPIRHNQQHQQSNLRYNSRNQIQSSMIPRNAQQNQIVPHTTSYQQNDNTRRMTHNVSAIRSFKH